MEYLMKLLLLLSSSSLDCASAHHFAKPAVHYAPTACLERSKKRAQETSPLHVKKSMGVKGGFQKLRV